MTEKRCTDCKYTKGIGYDFWCGEGHTEYEAFGVETNCPYYEYHDWSKGTPSRTEKRFRLEEFGLNFIVNDNGRSLTAKQTVDRLNELFDENEQLRKENDMLSCELSVSANKEISRNCRITELEKKNEDLKQVLKGYHNAFDCSQCRYHNYDWYDDGDEFEVCDKGNNEAQMEYHSCKDWKKL